MAIDTTQRGLGQSTEHGKRNAHEREKRERERTGGRALKTTGQDNISFASTKKKKKKKAP
jgi:hypothetical protein